jgi:hypothetical protein
VGRAAGQRLQRKAAGVTETIQRRTARRERARQQPVVALVEIEARLVAATTSTRRHSTVLDDGQRLVWRLAEYPAGHRSETLEPANARIRAFIDPYTAARALQRPDDRLSPFLGAGSRQLQDDGVAVAIGDQSGQTVGLAVNQPQVPLGSRNAGSQQATLDCRLHAPLEERVVDAFVRVESPHPGPNLRFRTPGGLGQRPAVGGDDLDGVARTSTTVPVGRPQPAKDPRMTGGQAERSLPGRRTS